MGRVTVRRRVVRVRDGVVSQRPDTLAAEEPMEIRVGGRAFTVTMRTPGNDFDLAAGFLVGEGVVCRSGDVAAIRYCAGATADGGNTYNVVDVALAPGVAAPGDSVARRVYTTSACGLCGKASLEAVRTTAPWTVADDPLRLSPALLSALPGRLRAAQRVFDATGGLHAAGLFSAAGELLCLREDVGRHNAVDKVIGHGLRAGLLPLRGTLLMVSGRASFELVQKAVMAGIPALAAVSAPSSLAVDLAEEAGLTLVGFLRGTSMNVYAAAERLESATAPATDQGPGYPAGMTHHRHEPPLPLDGYDELAAGEIEHRMRSLGREDVERLLRHEQAHAARARIVMVLRVRLAELDAGARPSRGSRGGAAPGPPAPTRRGSRVGPATAAPPHHPLPHGTPDQAGKPRP